MQDWRSATARRAAARAVHRAYDPDNHDTMVRLRQAEIDGIGVPDIVVARGHLLPQAALEQVLDRAEQRQLRPGQGKGSRRTTA